MEYFTEEKERKYALEEARQAWLVRQIMSLPVNEAVEMYELYQEELFDVGFILTHPDGTDFFEKFGIPQTQDIEVQSFFPQNKLIFLDNKSLECGNKLTNETAAVEANISFDTQIVKYLCREAESKLSSDVKGINEIIKLIKIRKLGVDCIPYVYENCLFDRSYIDSDLHKKNMLTFERYFYCDVVSELTTAQLIKLHQELFSEGYHLYYQRQYLTIYLYLLVISDLHLNTKMSVYEKEKALFEYCHNIIGIISLQEINLGKLFFLHDRKISFFGKIQKGQKNMSSILANMAWDIFHIHTCMTNFRIQTTRSEDYTIPLFVTYDKRLRDIMDIYKIKAVSFEKGTTNIYFLFNLDIIEPSLMNKYMTRDYSLERIYRREKESEQSTIDRIQEQIKIYEQKF